MRLGTHHVVMSWSLEGDKTTGTTSGYGKAFRKDCTAIVAPTVKGVLEIWRSLVWIKKQAKTLLRYQFGVSV